MVLNLVTYGKIFAGLVMLHNTIHLLPEIQTVKQDGIFSGQSKARGTAKDTQSDQAFCISAESFLSAGLELALFD